MRQKWTLGMMAALAEHDGAAPEKLVITKEETQIAKTQAKTVI
jgi:hypothetical protein